MTYLAIGGPQISVGIRSRQSFCRTLWDIQHGSLGHGSHLEFILLVPQSIPRACHGCGEIGHW